MKKFSKKAESKVSKMASFLKAVEQSAGSWSSKKHKSTDKFIRALRESKR